MNVVIKIDNQTKEKMINYYKDMCKDKVIPYVVFQAKDNDTVITMYESNKVMFQGPSADVDAAMWKEVINHDIKKEEEKEKAYYYFDAIGSDEVGTGDYFGPIVVSATYVSKENISYLEELGIRDSKKLTDDFILKVTPKIIKKIPYRSIILTNKEYNEKYNTNMNMNKIKAIMHNKVLYQLRHEITMNVDYIIVDEFAREKRYYEYIDDAINIQRNITFIQKAEEENLSVAAASIISRYIFLKEFEKIEQKLNTTLPKGSSKLVDAKGEELVQKYGNDILKKVAKYNFKNTNRILKTIIY